MNIYFCGIGGVGLGPLAEIAQDAGHSVQGSDPEESLMTKQLTERGIPINTKQQGKFLQMVHDRDRIDWFVYSSGIPDEHPELILAKQLGIKLTKRDELLNFILQQSNQKLIAIAGTHGKTTTESMMVWTLQQLGVPVSYSVGSTMSFGPSGKLDPNSRYLVYECDEFDRNFLQFHPYMSVITSVDYDHPDTYGSPEDYMDAFHTFLSQSESSILWQNDANLLGTIQQAWTINQDEIPQGLTLHGEHNRRNASLVIKAIARLGIDGDALAAINQFPGIDRRFEKVMHNVYSDYGHHPAEIEATLQLAKELNDDVVLVYQPHQNLRQHELRPQYVDCFMEAKDIYWLPTYLTRENPSLKVLSPEELIEGIENYESVHIADMNDKLWEDIQRARDRGALVVVMGAGSIDGWLREMASTVHGASVLVVDLNGNFVLQHRDDDPNISQPSKLSVFGGKVEPGDASLLQAAARELKEETNLSFNTEDLSYFKMTFSKEETGSKIHAYYVLTGADVSNLKVREGQGFEKVGPNYLGNHDLSLETRAIITEYTHPAFTDNG